MILKEEVIAYFKLLYQHSGGYDEKGKGKAIPVFN